MNSELLLLNEKLTDTFMQQTKTKAQGMLELKLKKQLETFSFSPPMNLSEDEKWLLAVTSFQTTNSVFNITEENKSFSISTPSFWNPEDGEQLVNKLNKLLELRSQNDIELHVREFKKRGTRTAVGNSGYNLAGFDHYRSQILAGLKRVEYKDREDMVYKMELTYDEIADILDVKYIGGSTIGYTVAPRTSEISETNLMLKS